jgi:transposase
MTEELVKNPYHESLWATFDERQRRLAAASYAQNLGYGGVSIASKATGLSRVTITKGIKELEEESLEPGRIHRPGAGRPSIKSQDPKLLEHLLALVDETSKGDPEIPKLWTLKSTRNLSLELEKYGHQVSHVKVGQLLKENGFSLQGNFKSAEGIEHIDRDAQFKYINNLIKKSIKKECPVISVDTKKKELIGNFDNKDQQWRKAKEPRRVNGHDFPGVDVPRAYPYGIYDFTHNIGFVNIGTDHDTSEFAVNSIKGWWRLFGKKLYTNPEYLLITADGGGSNGYRNRPWKCKLQELADYLCFTVKVCHFPPGTSKWNKIEHRLFSFISSNWRDEPLRDYETMVSLISSTKTAEGLTVRCRLDHRKYPTAIKITDEEMRHIQIVPAKFHGEWNYSINPR